MSTTTMLAFRMIIRAQICHELNIINTITIYLGVTDPLPCQGSGLSFKKTRGLLVCRVVGLAADPPCGLLAKLLAPTILVLYR